MKLIYILLIVILIGGVSGFELTKKSNIEFNDITREIDSPSDFVIGDIKISNSSLNTDCWKVANGSDGTVNMSMLSGTIQGAGGTASADVTVETYNSGEDGYWTVQGYVITQNFTVGTTGVNSNYNLTSVGVYGYETSAGSVINVSIGTTLGGRDIATGTKTNMADDSYTWDNITLDSFQEIQASGMYYLSMIVISGGYRWANDASGSYAGGNVDRSGTQWPTSDVLFYIYGNGTVVIPTTQVVTIYYKQKVC